MYFLKKMVIAAALVTTAATANAVEIIHYDNKPKTIELLSGDERTIQFGDHVAVGTTSSQDALFRVQSAQGALHILAYAPFEKQRIQVKRLGDGRIMLFDLTAKPQASDLTELEDISVFMPDENQVNTQGLPGGPGYDTRDNTVSAYDISPIELTRYAAHRFYAPQRLHKSHQGITSQPLGDLTEQTLRVFKGMTGANTDVSAVTSYRAGPYHLVALLVVNTADTSTTLDYLNIAVPFQYATLQHHSLAPSGEVGDRTMLYLINDRPAREFLMPWDEFAMAQETPHGK